MWPHILCSTPIHDVKVCKVIDAPYLLQLLVKFLILNLYFRKTLISYQDGVEIKNCNRAPLNKPNSIIQTKYSPNIHSFYAFWSPNLDQGCLNWPKHRFWNTKCRTLVYLVIWRHILCSTPIHIVKVCKVIDAPYPLQTLVKFLILNSQYVNLGFPNRKSIMSKFSPNNRISLQTPVLPKLLVKWPEIIINGL